MKVLHQPSPPGLRTALTDQQRTLRRSSSNCRIGHKCSHRQSASIRSTAVPSGELQAAAAESEIDRLSIPQEASASSNGSNGAQNAAANGSNGAHMPELVSPEDLVLEPGELSHIARSSTLDPADVFRCSGCLEEACQVCTAHLIVNTNSLVFHADDGPSVF